jgi:hypothetical protein
VKVLSGTALPFAPDTAVGFAEPALGNEDDEAEGLGVEFVAPPVEELAVTTPLELVVVGPVVVAEGAIAERT